MKRSIVIISGLVFVTIIALLICPLIGIVNVSPSRLLTDENMRYIVLTMRVPRVLAALIAGGGLAIAGMTYQALFRNPLADPYTLGVSSGAALGAALCILFEVGGAFHGLPFISFFAFAGALSAIFIVHFFAWSRESSTATLLLAGVVVATFCSGAIMFISFVGGVHKSFQILRWVVGGVDGMNFFLLSYLAVAVFTFLLVLYFFMPQLDQLLTGDELAHSRGVNIKASRNIIMTITALAIGVIVTLCGPIGFVGIIAPHACRLLIPGVRHRLLAFTSFLLGGTFLMISDALARSIAPPAEIPVGIVTALLGGPLFLFMLLRLKGKVFG